MVKEKLTWEQTQQILNYLYGEDTYRFEKFKTNNWEGNTLECIECVSEVEGTLVIYRIWEDGTGNIMVLVGLEPMVDEEYTESFEVFFNYLFAHYSIDSPYEVLLEIAEEKLQKLA